MGWFGLDAGHRSIAHLCAGVAALLLSCSAHAADTFGNARILYFEPFTTTIDPRPALMQKTSRSRQMKFDAYGRRFDLSLEPNEKLQSAANSASVTLYRGQLNGISGSWARIATHGSDVHGLVWDGQDLYVIEPGEAVRNALVPPLDASTTQTVLFKLSDTIIDAGASMCAVDDAQDASMKGSVAFKSLAREFSSMKRDMTMMQSGDAGLRVQLSAIGDAKFRQQFASDAEARDAILLRLNNVDGIFESQLGIEIQVPTTLIYDSTNDPLSTTTSASSLLSALGDLRDRTSELNSRGLTHLFTGRDLDGTTVGLGYVGSVCRKAYGAALTEIRGRGAWLESLITAHEIGHNFGAVHDGETQCSAIAQNQFVMSPTVHSTAATFSSCSRELVAKTIATASCVTSVPAADLSIAADLGSVRSSPGRTFEWELPVTNSGGRSAQDSHVEVLVPSSLRVSEVWVSGGSCTSGAGAISCELGEVPGGASRSLHITLNGEDAGSNPISAQVSSLVDADPMNNRAEGTIVIATAELDPPATLQAPSAPQLPTPTTGTTTEGGGGGGSFDPFWLLALLPLSAARRLVRP
ncbi:MAG TPA: M12 family metallo-peptidase [Steroidobacteraceae bacterium]|nr:M12 family metallo-peptidase [Steroidobacteraceae bacterium]